MSHRNGDRARHDKRNKRRIIRKEKTRAMRQEILKPVEAPKPA